MYRLLLGSNIVWPSTRPGGSLHIFAKLHPYSRFNRLVYVWGYNGYCRLGLGNQVDALKPKVVPQVRTTFSFSFPQSPALTTCVLQFAGPNEATMASAIAAGPTNSVVIDKQGMYWMAGKWKNSGEGTFSSYISTSRNQTYARAGSSGSPYSTFRFMQDIMYVVPL